MNNAENAWTWIIKVVAGLLIVVILGVHFIVNHALAPGGLLTYADVVRYYQNPLVVAMEIIFLFLVVSHALLGLRSILIDLNPSHWVIAALNYVFIVVGIGSIVYGIWLALTIASKGSMS